MKLCPHSASAETRPTEEATREGQHHRGDAGGVRLREREDLRQQVEGHQSEQYAGGEAQDEVHPVAVAQRHQTADQRRDTRAQRKDDDHARTLVHMETIVDSGSGRWRRSAWSHVDLAAEPGAGAELETVPAPEPAGVVPVWPALRR